MGEGERDSERAKEGEGGQTRGKTDAEADLDHFACDPIETLREREEQRRIDRQQPSQQARLQTRSLPNSIKPFYQVFYMLP